MWGHKSKGGSGIKKYNSAVLIDAVLFVLQEIVIPMMIAPILQTITTVMNLLQFVKESGVMADNNNNKINNKNTNTSPLPAIFTSNSTSPNKPPAPAPAHASDKKRRILAKVSPFGHKS
ncbi:hypothetical protein ACA910_000245 [Epithemia clementina (nom. ined.)]